MLASIRFFVTAFAAMCFGTVAQAQVPLSNSVIFDVRLGTDLFEFMNNVALDSATGRTNPLFRVRAGDTLLFGFSLSGNRPDQVSATFAGVPVIIADPNIDGTVLFAPTLGGGANYQERLTYATAGTFNGTIRLDALLSDPDYAFGGTTPVTNAPVFTYRIEVSAVPEPASWAFMIMGVGAVGGALRTARSRRTIRSVAI